MVKPAGNGIIVFAGTSEGRFLYEFCAKSGIRAIFCVATEYGRQVLCGAEASGPVIRTGRMEEAEMLALFREKKPVLIIDATHPYAAEATDHIRKAAERYRQNEQIQARVYYRVLRSLSEAEDRAEEEAEDAAQGETDVMYCPDMEQAVAYLNRTTGNILVTTGSKQLKELCKLVGYADRVYLRVLPNPAVLQECLDNGFQAGHVICMQGPFSEEMNVAVLQEYNICYILTKQSGRTGGYPQKITAAGRCGVKPVVILPPQETDGVSVEAMKEILKEAVTAGAAG